MADINPQVQQFSPSNFGYAPLTRRPQTATPLSALEGVNTLRGLINLEKEQALLEPSIAAGKATSEQAITGANTAKLENMRKQQANSTQNLLKLLNQKKPVTDNDIENHVRETILNAGGTPEVLKQALQNLPKGGTDLENRAFIAKHATNSLSAEAQMSSLFPNAEMQNVGGAIVPTATGNPVLANQPPGTQVGPAIPTTIAPQVVTNQITGAPYVIGGGRQPGNQPSMGNVPLNQVQPQGQPVQPQAPNMPVQNAPVQPQTVQSRPQAQLQQLPNESPANFNARVAQVQGSLVKAQDQLNNPESEFGSIPTLKTVNKNILNLLKDKSVDTGAVQDYLAKRSNKGLSNPKEQELAKYLEQRIQARTPKSDADAESKKAAYGSFNLSKEALTNLVRQDNAWITQKELQATGVLKNAGSATNPNFGKVAEFNNKFTQYSSDPELMKYIAIIGDNPGKSNLDESDIADLRKDFGSLSKDKLQKMELKRKTLLNLVNGAQ